MKHNILYILALLLMLLPCGRAAAADDPDWSGRLESARKLYYSGSYYAAEKAFDELAASISGRNELKQSEIEAYKVLCAIALDRVNIDGMVKVFSDKYPNAPELSMVRYALASKYFDRGRYAEAGRILRHINEKYLYKGWRTEFRFKRGFCEMTQGRRKEATEDFESIIASKAAHYTYPSLYYLGYVKYLDRQFEDACGLFVKAAADSRFKLMSSYYLLESKFLSGDYYYVIDNGLSVFDSIGTDLKPNVARILSESYFSLGDSQQAQRYMDIYEASATEISRKDHYLSAMLSYSLESWPRAITSFGKVIGEADSLTQSARYYKANCHLRSGNKLAAIIDFKEASELPFDAVIAEDAMFNYAKLSFDVNSDISRFAEYLEKYPSGQRSDIINNYMAMALIDREDYETAVTMLRKITNPSPEVASNLQKASFLRAMQLVEGGAWRSALPMLDISTGSGSSNPELDNLATFWKAECLFRDERYADAIAANNKILSDKGFKRSAEYPMAIYNQAYCYFKRGEYDAAQKWFSDYLACSDTYFEKDARIRMADAHYMQNDYSTAAALYEGISDRYPGSDDIYPLLQAALAYGLSGSENKKVELLSEAVGNHPSAPLYPKALYELGRAYAQQDKGEDAAECFLTLLGVKSDSTYLSKALLELAMINSNAGKYDKALEYYRSIVKRAPDTEMAKDALAGMENIYRIINKPNEYLAYIDEMGLSSSKTDDERGAMLFAAAEQLYYQGNYASATNEFQSYIASYPKGKDYAKACYLLAESLRRTGRKEAASDAYRSAIEAGGNYREASLGSYALLNFELERYDKASKAYGILAETASMDDVRCSAFSGKMRSDYRARRYDTAIASADSVLSFTHSAKSVLREAGYVKAMSLVSSGDRRRAVEIFDNLASDTSDEYGAESAYMLILNAFNAGDYDSVEDRTYRFSESGSSQMYWLAKSFIVLGDAFASRGDRVQAEATYRSIADGYKPSVEDDVLRIVNDRLAKLSNSNE